MSARRRTAALLSVAAVVALSAGPLLSAPVSAAEEPGSGLGSFAMAASAPAVQLKIEESNFCFGSTAGKSGCELVLPEVVSTLRYGPLGAATAAVVWPGALAADFGSLLITASDSKVPEDAKALNDPVRAEARTSTGPDTVVYDDVPGTHMKAVAKDDQTSAEASIESSQTVPSAASFGKVNGSSSAKLTGASLATVHAHSEVNDIDVAGGVLHIDSVVSDATGTSDGITAKATGKTVASGMYVAGIPITVGDDGITVHSANVPTSVATAAVNTALNNAGIIIAMGSPTGKPDGSSITYSAGSLVVLWKTPGATFTVALGGVNVSVEAEPALDFSFPEDPVVDPVVPPVTGGTLPPVPGVVTPPIEGGVAPTPELPGVQPPAVTPPETVTPETVAARLPLPGGLSPWAAVLGLGSAGLVMAGLKRLPDKLLVASVPDCLIEETA